MGVSGFLFLSLKNSNACITGYYKITEKIIKGGGVLQGMLGMFILFFGQGIAAG